MPGFAGFDRSDYPGDQVMNWLRANTNLVWCAYYLGPAPSHPGTSWMTRRAALAAAGWGIAPLYVGEQITGPGSQHPSAAKGTTDGNQAASMMAQEKFPHGSFVYLDLENGPPMTQPLTDYVVAWCDAVSATAYRPGVYCSHLLALTIHNLRPECRIWCFNVQTTNPHPVPNPFPDPNPSGCGYIGAYVWQLGQHCQIATTLGGPPTFVVDLDSALTPDPGTP